MSQSIVQSLRRWDPDWIGPFAIVGRLGAGAMGQVYLARSTAGRLVAVKTIRVELAEEPGFRARFAREVAAARRVSGVFTAAVAEADPEADLPWLATAVRAGAQLSTLVRRCGPLPVPAVRWLAAGCAEALQSIHDAGLLHRDVKPSNVLVAPGRSAGHRLRRGPGRRAGSAHHHPRGAGHARLHGARAGQGQLRRPRRPATSSRSARRSCSPPPATRRTAGETVMDILVRLATEPPDLDGVPPELTDLVAACLQRVPRDRPTDAAILDAARPVRRRLRAGRYRPFLPAGRRDGADRRVPAEPAAGPGVACAEADGEDGACGGHGRVGRRVGARRRHVRVAYGTAGLRLGRPPCPRRRYAVRPAPALPPAPPGGARAPGPGTAGGPPPAAPEGDPPGAGGRCCGRARRSPRWCCSARGRPSGCRSRVGAPDRRHRADDPGAAAVVVPDSGTEQHAAAVRQPALRRRRHGVRDPRQRLRPFAPVTVKLVGVGVSPDHPVADMQGTFNYAIDQGHYFFNGRDPA